MFYYNIFIFNFSRLFFYIFGNIWKLILFGLNFGQICCLWLFFLSKIFRLLRYLTKIDFGYIFGMVWRDVSPREARYFAPGGKVPKTPLRGRVVSIPLSLLKLPHPKTTQRGAQAPLWILPASPLVVSLLPANSRSCKNDTLSIQALQSKGRILVNYNVAGERGTLGLRAACGG